MQWSRVTSQPFAIGLAVTLSLLVLVACDEPNEVHISLPPPYAGKTNPAGAERVLAGARVRLREKGFVHQGGAANEHDGEVWVWHEGRPDALRTRLGSSDDGVTITLRQVSGERGPEFNAAMNTLDGVVGACMTLPSASGSRRP